MCRFQVSTVAAMNIPPMNSGDTTPNCPPRNFKQLQRMNLKRIPVTPLRRMQRDSMHTQPLCMFHHRIGRVHTAQTLTHSTNHFRTEQQPTVLFRPEQKKRNATELHAVLGVNLARKPAPMASPSHIRSHRLVALQRLPEDHQRQRPEKTLNESIVIRMEPTAISNGITDATNRHHSATRSS